MTSAAAALILTGSVGSGEHRALSTTVHTALKDLTRKTRHWLRVKDGKMSTSISLLLPPRLLMWLFLAHDAMYTSTRHTTAQAACLPFPIRIPRAAWYVFFRSHGLVHVRLCMSVYDGSVPLRAKKTLKERRAFVN